MMNETVLDRLTLLHEGQFEQVARLVGVPKESLPGDEAGRTEQANALMAQARTTDPTLSALKGVLLKMHPQPLEPKQRVAGGWFMAAAAICFALLAIVLLGWFAATDGSISAVAAASYSKL